MGVAFVYVLVRKNSQHFKIGVSADLEHRLKSLMQVYGPFSNENSFCCSFDTKSDAKSVEDSLKNAFANYRFEMPKFIDNRNGETEWFISDCLDKLRTKMNELTADRGVIIGTLNLTWMSNTDLQKTDLSQRLENYLSQQSDRFEALKLNARSILLFRHFIRDVSNQIIGMIEVQKENSIVYELYISNDFPREALSSLQSISVRTEREDNLWVSNCVCVFCTGTNDHIKLSFKLPGISKFKKTKNFPEKDWESERFIKQYMWAFKRITQCYRLPPAYEKYIGRTAFDDLIKEEKNELHRQLWQWILQGDELEIWHKYRSG